VSDIGLTVKAAKEGFFDRKAVADRIGTEKTKVLSKMGAFVQRRAKSSIKKAPKASAKKSYVPQAGKPPRSRNGLLKDFILFSYDKSTDSVVVGAALLGGFRQSTPGPAALEKGGNVEFFASKGRKAKRVTFRKFPFMVPALEAERPKFPELWSGAIRQ